MNQAAPKPSPVDRLSYFRHLREQLAPARDPADAFQSGLYVDYPTGVSRRIAAELELATTSSHVLVGGVGSGKTTELLAIKKRLGSVNDVLTFFIDVSQHHDVDKLRPGAVAVQVGLALGEWLSTGDLSSELYAAIQRLQNLAHGTVDDGRSDADGDYPLHMAGILVQPDQLDENVKLVQQHMKCLLDSLTRRGQRVVVLLDGLDRVTSLDAFESTVRHDILSLSKLGVSIVLVAPLRALYGMDRAVLDPFDQLYYQPWVDPEHDEVGRSLLSELLRKRAKNAIDSQGLEALLLHSGGVARDLLALAQSACVQAYLEGVDGIGLSQVSAAIDAFGRKHMQGLRSEEIEVLQRVQTTGQFVPTSENDLALLMTRRVLEYRDANNKPRYVVHPTIANFLKSIAA